MNFQNKAKMKRNYQKIRFQCYCKKKKLYKNNFYIKMNRIKCIKTKLNNTINKINKNHRIL